jgi:cytochrome b involved in lipid metabolism
MDSAKKMCDPEQGEMTSVSSSDAASSDTSKSPCEETSVEVINKEQPASPDNITKNRSNNNKRKCISIFVGMTLLVGFAVAIASLVDFMKEGDVQFLQSGPSTASVTPDELALHNTEDDCWVALYGDVYDFTKYARRHPNGPKDIVELAGTDGTAEYEREHSISLLRSVQNDIVGRLSTAAEESYQDEISTNSNWKDYGSSYDSNSGSDSGD